MLDQLSRHSLMDLKVRAKGDLHIDAHHTTEDVGIALGQAFHQALGDMKGIVRYASIDLPMDETLTRAAVDVSGRPYLIWKVAFTRDKVGDYDTELFREFFMAFAQNAEITLHIENLMVKITITSLKPVSRRLRGCSERRLQSTRAWPIICRPQRASLVGDFRYCARR